VTTINRMTVLFLIALTGAVGLSSETRGEDADGRKETPWLAALDEKIGEPAPGAAVAAEAPGWTKPIPIGFYLDYTVATDYIWRGINFSEFRGEGREKLNHQLTAGVNYDTGDFGKIDFSVWFEWYGANDRITGVNSDGNLQ